MPISSGAPARAKGARSNKSNLRRSPNWPDVARASSSPAASETFGQPQQPQQTGARISGSATKLVGPNDRSALAPAAAATPGNQAGRPIKRHDLHSSRANSHTGRALDQRPAHQPTGRLERIMNSLGGQRVLTGGAGGLQAASQSRNRPAETAAGASEKTTPSSGGSSNTMAPSAKQATSSSSNLFGSLILSGNAPIEPGAAASAHSDSMNDYKKPRMLGGKTYMISGNGNGANNNGNLKSQAPNCQHLNHQTGSKSSLKNSQASLLLSPCQSMSFLGGQPSASASANSSAAHSASSLASLHGLHNHQGAGQQRPAPLNISRRVNLKYVKSLIVLLMSLDLLITLFVHHFASHDELALAFTSHKLRFSLLNLALSSIWFVVLAGAIIFDLYPILLVGCLVDFASFVLLLVCSAIHFTHRIDYNAVSLSSLLLLLFAIVVLHVYLLAIAALTTYLMLAVKRRRKIQS